MLRAHFIHKATSSNWSKRGSSINKSQKPLRYRSRAQDLQTRALKVQGKHAFSHLSLPFKLLSNNEKVFSDFRSKILGVPSTIIDRHFK